MKRLVALSSVLGLALVALAGWLLVPRAAAPVADASAELEPAPTAERAPEPAMRAGVGPPMAATTPEEVREVLAFTRGAGAEELESLRRMALESSDPLVAGNALRALGRLGTWSGDEELMALLDDPRARVRQDAVVALGQSRDPDAVAHLAPLLEEDDATLRALTIQALGRIGGERSRELLESMREDPRASDAERAFLRDALAAVGPGGRQAATASDAQR